MISTFSPIAMVVVIEIGIWDINPLPAICQIGLGSASVFK